VPVAPHLAIHLLLLIFGIIDPLHVPFITSYPTTDVVDIPWQLERLMIRVHVNLLRCHFVCLIARPVFVMLVYGVLFFFRMTCSELTL